MSNFTGGLNSQASAYDYSRSSLPVSSSITQSPKLKSKLTKNTGNEAVYNINSKNNASNQFSLNNIPNENVSSNSIKSARFNTSEVVTNIAIKQENEIYSNTKIQNEFNRNKSFKLSLAVNAIKQSKYSTNEVYDLSSWNNLTKSRQQQISDDIYNLTISGKRIDLQLVASNIIWRNTNG